MKKLTIFLILGVMIVALTGCDGDKETDSNDVKVTQSAKSTPDSRSSGDEESTFTWPSEIPANLQKFDGVTFTTYARDTYSENAWTMFFECSDKQKVDDYIKQLKDLGYKQDNYSANNTGLDYNGKSDEAEVHINYVSGGLSKLYVSIKTAGTGTTSKSAAQKTGTTASNSAWPAEFSTWDVPTIKNATVESSTNKSATQKGMTQGVNVVVTLKNLTKADLDAYIKTLSAKGYAKNDGESFGDTMLIYDKNVTGGVIKIMLLYGEDITTMTVNNSAAAAAKDAAVGGSVKWPDSAKVIPEFTKGKYKETVDMSGGIYALTFVDVKDTDLVWYRDVLKKAGFTRIDDEEDTESYTKTDKSKMYSVGFELNDGTLQIIIMSGNF